MESVGLRSAPASRTNELSPAQETGGCRVAATPLGGDRRSHGRSSVAGDHEGREAAFALFGRYGGETGGTFKAELRYVLADDDGHAVGIHHNSAERDGKQLDVDCALVFEIKDGRVVDGREHFYDLNAWDEFWS
jgi:uncharacterized protein